MKRPSGGSNRTPSAHGAGEYARMTRIDASRYYIYIFRFELLRIVLLIVSSMEAHYFAPVGILRGFRTTAPSTQHHHAFLELQ